MNKILIVFLTIIFFLRQIMILNANNDTYINTTNIIYDENRNIVEVSDNSLININNTNILVDRGIIDYNNDLIEVYGDFYLYQEFNILSGKDLVGNTSLNNFTAFKVSYIYNNDLKIDSDKAQRANDIVYFYNNFLTPCELNGYFNCPTWSLKIDKTKYDINNDKFTHFDSFLQIADYKVFYLPYFSHYGSKAPRQKGFLSPTLEFSIGGDTGLITPYYFPIGSSSDIIFRPRITFDDNFEYTENFSLDTVINNKTSGGNINLKIHTNKLRNNNNVYNSAKLEAKQVLNKNNILNYNAMITNSVSTTRSTNEEPLTFEDIFIRLDSYNVFHSSDYLKTEISTVEALDSTKPSFIPLTPTAKYINQILLKQDLSIRNEIDLITLKRNESNSLKPSESSIFKINNSLFSNTSLNNFYFYNKANLFGSIGNYKFEHNPNLNDDIFKVNSILSSDIFLKLNKNIKPRLKIIQNFDLVSDEIVNEDSRAIAFNYLNQFSDSRFFGNDTIDNTGRIVYGLENNISPFGKKIDININQSYDFENNTNYTNQINQNNKVSDIALETKTDFNKFNFNLDARLNKNQLEKKEMNYSLNYSGIYDLNLTYNETDKSSYKGLSSDTKSLGIIVGKEINENIKLLFNTDLDLKNDYSPYTQSIILSLYDECSKLDITYVDERFNDNYNTQPNETIRIKFSMDYLGFFGYEQKSNLFFEEPGSFDYGL